MADFKIAKVILYMDGSVHICLNDYRTFYATIGNLMAFFSDPISFVSNDINQEAESTQEINMKRRPLDKMLGVTLAYLTSNKEVICNFPELFQFIFSSSSVSSYDSSYVSSLDSPKNERLNMHSYVFERDLSDAKSFLLKYYLDFVNNYDRGTIIQNKLDISEEAFFSILREIFNSAFSFEPPSKPHKTLDDRLNDVTKKELLSGSSNDADNDYVPLSEYAILHNLSHSAVSSMIRTGQIKDYKKEGRFYFVNKHVKPAPSISSIKNKKSTSKPAKNSDTGYLSNSEDWPAAKVEAYIIDNRLFSSAVARYIFSKQELDYYVKAGFLEVEWNGRRCLIKDFDIHYKGKDGRSNSERMRKGEPPVLPDPRTADKPDTPVELHHLGQRDSVFVTLEKYIHTGAGYSAIFHSSAPNENLHTKLFESEKAKFWKTYIEEYEKAGSFDKIPHIYPTKSHRKGK